MSIKYERGNRYADWKNIADAAVEWQGLSSEQIQRVIIGDDFLPDLVGYPDLHERAEGLFIAAQNGQIKGFVHNENGDYFSPKNMRLDRDSVADWIKKTEKRLTQEQPIESIKPDLKNIDTIASSLRINDVYKAIGVSLSKFKRMRTDGSFPEPNFLKPRILWYRSVVSDYILKNTVKNGCTNEADLPILHTPNLATDEDI